MTAITRVGDIGVGICYFHRRPTPYTTTFSTGADSVLTNGQVSCTIGTIGIASCGHPTTALTGSGDVFADESGFHRIGDTGMNGGPYTVVSGSGDVFSND